jgi:hypothetical protein
MGWCMLLVLHKILMLLLLPAINFPDCESGAKRMLTFGQSHEMLTLTKQFQIQM